MSRTDVAHNFMGCFFFLGNWCLELLEDLFVVSRLCLSILQGLQRGFRKPGHKVKAPGLLRRQELQGFGVRVLGSMGTMGLMTPVEV